jgi:hypothetical protein
LAAGLSGRRLFLESGAVVDLPEVVVDLPEAVVDVSAAAVDLPEVAVNLPEAVVDLSEPVIRESEPKSQAVSTQRKAGFLSKVCDSYMSVLRENSLLKHT